MLTWEAQFVRNVSCEVHYHTATEKNIITLKTAFGSAEATNLYSPDTF